MSIDNIQLPVSLYATLYKKKLVDLDNIDGTMGDEIKSKFDFLGGNHKNIAIILNNEMDKFLDDNQLKFLSGLIAACNLTIADIAIVNLSHNKNINHNDLIVQLASRKVLSFGVSPAELDLPFSIPFFQVQTFQQIQYMFCPGLEQLQVDTDAKKQLWASLQNIFKITMHK